jgi:hypothetical protein
MLPSSDIRFIKAPPYSGETRRMYPQTLISLKSFVGSRGVLIYPLLQGSFMNTSFQDDHESTTILVCRRSSPFGTVTRNSY